MNKENQKIPNEILVERWKSLQREREQANNFMNNFIKLHNLQHSDQAWAMRIWQNWQH